MSEDLKVLVIAENYRAFLKESIEAVSNYVDSQSVFIRHNVLTELSNYLPSFGFLENTKRFRKEKLINLGGIPENLNINIISMVYFIPDGKNKSLGYKIFKKIDRYIEENDIKFDIIHSYFLWNSGIVGAKLKQKYDKPLIVTGLGFDVYDVPFRGKPYKEKILYVLEQADQITTVTSKMKKIMRNRLFVPDEKLSVVPNGVDTDKFYPMDKEKARKRLGLPLNRKIIVNVGNLLPVKGQKYLVDSTYKLINKNKMDDLLTIIVGSGKNKKDLESKIQKLGLEHNVKLVGQRPHSEIPLWMNASDLFVLPSVRESFGIVQLEAMACGCPVVATKNGGSEEIIESDRVGILCETKDPYSLAKSIENALNITWNQNEIVDYLHRNFLTWDDFGKKITDIYDKTV